ncbi:MAG: AAA family ATPase [Candidatus Marsarchaeota archaeon]|nr:AAA family ATPase [Candidatus Marsarchaeota archaeon]
MVNIFQATVHCSKILVNEEVFRPQFAPKEVLHRKDEIRRIADALRPLTEGRTPDNLLILGGSGSGKTAAIQYVLKQLNEHTSRTKAIYVNCWQHHTRMAIYSLIANALGEILPRRGLATDEVFDRIMETMGKEGLRCVIVLDELDGLIFHGEGQFIHDILRAGSGKPLFGIVAISNNPVVLKGLDPRIADTASFSTLAFKPYTQPQIEEILSRRAEEGLVPYSWDSIAVKVCGFVSASSGGNLHIGMEALLKSAKEAERKRRLRIGMEDVAKVAFSKAGPDATFSPAAGVPQSSLCDGERLILELLRGGETDSTSLYSQFNQRMPRSERQVRNYLMMLEARHIVKSRIPDADSPIGNRKLVSLWCQA